MKTEIDSANLIETGISKGYIEIIKKENKNYVRYIYIYRKGI